MKTTYNYDSLIKHNVSRYEVDEVYASGKDFDLPASKRGNDRIMIVGWTAQGRLLKVGIEYLPNGVENIFHASDMTMPYRKLFISY